MFVIRNCAYDMCSHILTSRCMFYSHDKSVCVNHTNVHAVINLAKSKTSEYDKVIQVCITPVLW